MENSNKRQDALKYFRETPGFDEVVKSGIERYRKGNAELRLLDEDGKVIAGEATIEYQQLNHEFKYGANLFMLDEFESEEKNSLYREVFAKTFNLATLPFYWDSIEPEKGKYRFEKNCEKMYRRPAIDACLEYCREKGIEPKAHCLSYLYPKWMFGASVQKTKEEMENRMRVLSQRYAKQIPSWEVTNETLRQEHFWATKFFDEPDYVEWCFRTADKYFPLNRLIINDEWVSIKRPLHNRNPYYMQIERMLQSDKNIHLDSIGFQFHGFYNREDEHWHISQMYNPEYMYKLLDLWGAFGKPLQVTEMTLPAFSNDKEDEEVQAELVYNLYRMFFSHPAMEAIIYWNLVDGYAGGGSLGDMTVGENVFYGNFMRFDMSEKPSLKVIQKLFNEEWRTEGKSIMKDGVGLFRGFWGDYKVSVHYKGKTYERIIKLSKNNYNRFDIVISSEK